jgi:hypothetical protein
MRQNIKDDKLLDDSYRFNIIYIYINFDYFQIFTWKLLENLYYRDKKFSIEVHDPKR